MGNSSPLRTTIRNDDVDGMRTILQKAGEGAPDLINEDFTGDCLCERTRNIQSPLHTCVGRRKHRMVELLLQYGADVTAGGRNGMTVLHYAAKGGDADLCRMLVTFKADPAAEDNDGQRPVHAAAAAVSAERDQQVDTLRYLIEDVGQLSDVNVKDVDGRTPLHVAAFWGYVGLARYLIDKGADKEAKSVNGKTPRDEAIANRKLEMADLLLQCDGGQSKNCEEKAFTETKDNDATQQDKSPDVPEFADAEQ